MYIYFVHMCIVHMCTVVWENLTVTNCMRKNSYFILYIYLEIQVILLQRGQLEPIPR